MPDTNRSPDPLVPDTNRSLIRWCLTPIAPRKNSNSIPTRASQDLRSSWIEFGEGFGFPRHFSAEVVGKELVCSAAMGRHPRAFVAGGTYHVMNRGNRKAAIFEDDRDRRRFLRILIEERERHCVDTLAGCQLGNHFHLLLTTRHENLSEFMQQLEGRFACYSNWRHERIGHVFQGRFRAVTIEHDVHLFIALCYIFFNPVSAGLVTRLEDFKWSTYAATVGLAPVPSYLSIDWLEALFPGESREEAQLRFRNLITEAKPVVAYLRQHEFGMDQEAVRRAVRSYIGEQLQLGMLPSLYRSALRSPLADLFQKGMTVQARASMINDAHVIHGYKLAEIARHLHMRPATVSRIFRSSFNSRRC